MILTIINLFLLASIFCKDTFYFIQYRMNSINFEQEWGWKQKTINWKQREKPIQKMELYICQCCWIVAMAEFVPAAIGNLWSTTRHGGAIGRNPTLIWWIFGQPSLITLINACTDTRSQEHMENSLHKYSVLHKTEIASYGFTFQFESYVEDQ